MVFSHLNINGWTDNNKHLRESIINYSKADILSINETKLKNDEKIDCDGFYWFGNNRSYVHVDAPTASGGVGFLVRNSMAECYNFEEVDKSYNDIIAMKFSHKHNDFSFLVISAYLPPENSPWGRDASAFFSHLLQLIYTYNNVDAIFLMGDFNSRISNLPDNDEALDGIPNRCANVDEKINGHGRGFVDFLIDSKCCVLNGRVSPEKSNQYTFHSVRGLSLVDYFVVPHDNLVLCKDLIVESCSDIVNKLGVENQITPVSKLPDHCLLSLTVDMRFQVLEGINVNEYNEFGNNNVHKSWKRKYKVRNIPEDFLSSDNVCLALQNIIENIQCNRETQKELDEIYDNLISIIIDEMNAKLLVPESRHTRKRFKIKKPYWNSELGQAWKLMHLSEIAFRSCKGTRRERLALKAVFTTNTHSFDKLLKQTKRIWDRGQLLDIEKLKTGNPTEFWHHISRLGPRKSNNIPMETVLDDGTVIRNKAEVMKKWQHDYENLYLNESEEYDYAFLLECKQTLSMYESRMLDPLYECNNELNINVDIGEITRVLKNAKNNKTAGIDQIPYEVWKCSKLLSLIQNLFQYCLDTGKIPTSWTQAIISPIPKSNKHDKRLPLSYRGISLLSCLYKLYSAFLNMRLQKYIENNNILSDEQNGFRESRSCEDHVFVMDTVINTHLDQKKPVYACFVDFSKAFDLINRDQLMLQILNKNIDGNFYWSLKSLYSSTTSCLKINGEYTNFFNIHNGVRQGDPLSPTLFSLFIDSLIKELKSLNLGLDIEGLILTVLAYADDLVILSDTEEKLQKLMDCLTNWCAKWRLSINNAKSGVIHFRNTRVKKTNYKFMLAGKQVDVVSDYKYLGVVLDEHLTYKVATKTLANAGGRALGGIISKFKTFKDIGYDTYTKLFDNCVSPILEYGAGVWAPGKKFPDIDNIMLRACRYYLGVHRFAPIPGVLGEMGWIPNSVRRQIASCRLWNRLINMDNSRLTKQIFNYNLAAEGKFSKFISDICDECNLSQSFSQRNILDLKLIQQREMTAFVEDWKQNVQSKPKLRTYVQVKSDYGVERYVKSFVPKYKRSLMAQMRLSILPIRLETGRFVCERLEERVCKLCELNRIEDEYHVLLECPCYNEIRDSCLNNIDKPTFTSLNNVMKQKFLFENHPYITGNLLANIMAKRKSVLYK